MFFANPTPLASRLRFASSPLAVAALLPAGLVAATLSSSGLIKLSALSALQLGVGLWLGSRRRINVLGCVLVGHFLAFSQGRWFEWAVDGALAFPEKVLRELDVLLWTTPLTIMVYWSLRAKTRIGDLSIGAFQPVPLRPWQAGALLTILLLWTGGVAVPTAVAAVAAALVHLLMLLAFCATVSGYPRGERWLRALALAGAIQHYLVSGSLLLLSAAGLMSLLRLILAGNWRGLARWGALVFVLLCLHASKDRYRKFLAHHPQASPVARLIQAGSLVPTVLRENLPTRAWLPPAARFPRRDRFGGERYARHRMGSLGAFSLRLSDTSLERVLNKTPRVVPYWNGKTYRDLLVMPVPRLLWPDKPRRVQWHEFGRKYRFLKVGDRQTSVQFNYLAEGYMNFGIPGLILAALLFGALAAAGDWLGRSPHSRLGSFLFMAFAWRFLYPRDASTMVADVAFTALLVLPLRWLAAPGRAPQPEGHRPGIVQFLFPRPARRHST